MKKRYLLLIPVILCLAWAIRAFAHDTSRWREGDIVFQTSQSRQSPYVQLATLSTSSHCGIVVMKDRKPYVLEASKTVRLTPLKQWIRQGKLGAVETYRVYDKPLKIRYKKYLGKPYDLSFKFGNDKWYCSELVYDIYLRQYGLKLCKPRKVSSYHLYGLKKLLRKRGISPDQYVVAPSDLQRSKLLHRID